MNTTIIEKLKKLASKQTCNERNNNFCAADTGNYDDTFDMGINDGEIYQARQILHDLKLELQEKSKEESFFDNEMANIGDFDSHDAWEQGIKDSKILLARKILEILSETPIIK